MQIQKNQTYSLQNLSNPSFEKYKPNFYAMSKREFEILNLAKYKLRKLGEDIDVVICKGKQSFIVDANGKKRKQIETVKYNESGRHALGFANGFVKDRHPNLNIKTENCFLIIPSKANKNFFEWIQYKISDKHFLSIPTKTQDLESLKIRKTLNRIGKNENNLSKEELQQQLAEIIEMAKKNNKPQIAKKLTKISDESKDKEAIEIQKMASDFSKMLKDHEAKEKSVELINLVKEAKEKFLSGNLK